MRLLLLLSVLIVLVRSEFGDRVDEQETVAAQFDTYTIQDSENSVNGAKPIETYQPHFVKVTKRRRVNGTLGEPKVLIDRRSNNRGKPLGLEDLRVPGLEVPEGEYGPPYESPTTQTQPPTTSTTKKPTTKITTTEKITTTTKAAENATWTLDKNIGGNRFKIPHHHHHHHHKRNNESAKSTTTTTTPVPTTVVSFVNLKPHHHHHHRSKQEAKNITAPPTSATFNVTFLSYPNANPTQSPNIFNGFLTVAKEATTLITEAFNSIAKVFIQPNNSQAKRNS